jgi:hypothetical protein
VSTSYNGYYDGYSSWDNWGRWVATAGIIIFFILLFCLCSCITARRRRRFGRTPLYGTGWAGRGWGQQQQQYYPPQQENNPTNYYAYQQPPGPIASPPPPYPASQGYGQQPYGYGARDQQSGIELESPAGAYAPPKVGPTNGMAGMPPMR